jgi:hypothetical protein
LTQNIWTNGTRFNIQQQAAAEHSRLARFVEQRRTKTKEIKINLKKETGRDLWMFHRVSIVILPFIVVYALGPRMLIYFGTKGVSRSIIL